MTYDEWEPIAAELLAAYPLLAVPAETIVKYANDLSDLDAHSVKIGARVAVKQSPFFPTIALIRECAKAEASRFVAQELRPERQFSEARPESPEESKRLVEKWGPRIRAILSDAKGPMAQDLKDAVG